MDWVVLTDFLMTLSPIVGYVFMGLGAVVVLATAIDGVIPDSKDKGFSKKILAMPILGDFLIFITRFSPFNIRK